MSWMYGVVAFLLPFVFVIFVTPGVMRLAWRVGAVDKPGPRKVHAVPTPRLGGLAIVTGVVLTLVPFAFQEPRLIGILLGGVLVVTLGIVDDIRGLGANFKLVVQILAALAAVSSGVRVEFLTLPFEGLVYTSILAIPITLLWIVGVTNAVNLLDGLDGLASGVISVASVTLAFLGWYHGSEVAAIGALALCGASLAFLKYNSYPAKVFMGDTGSTFSGYLLATLSVLGFAKGATLVSLLIPVFILAVPILDTLTVMTRRVAQGQPIFHADRGHLHHKLMDSGLGHVRTVYFEYVIAALSGIAAVLVGQVPLGYYLIAVSFLLILIIGMFDGGITRLVEYIVRGHSTPAMDEMASASESGKSNS